MIYQLMYFSCAETGLERQDIDDIVATAQTANRKYDISGFLTFNGTEFLQFLEGTEEAVTQLMNNIELDKRHHSVVTIEAGHAESRRFPGWTLHRLPDAPRRGVSEILPASAPQFQDVLSALRDPFRRGFQNFLHG